MTSVTKMEQERWYKLYCPRSVRVEPDYSSGNYVAADVSAGHTLRIKELAPRKIQDAPAEKDRAFQTDLFSISKNCSRCRWRQEYRFYQRIVP